MLPKLRHLHRRSGIKKAKQHCPGAVVSLCVLWYCDQYLWGLTKLFSEEIVEHCSVFASVGGVEFSAYFFDGFVEFGAVREVELLNQEILLYAIEFVLITTRHF